MQPDSVQLVDQWAADLLGLPEKLLWQSGVTVGMHAGLGDYPGVVVMGRDDAVHVSLPGWSTKAMVDELVEVAPHRLMDPKFWKDHPRTLDLKVIGPSVHGFRDTPMDAPNRVEQIHPADIEHWRDLVSRRKWEESGFASNVLVAFAIRVDDEIVAASNLTAFRGTPSDVGLLTHPKHRGKGYSVRVARAATSYAVNNAGLARFRSLRSNERSRTMAASLGFDDYFDQLTIRPRE